MSGCGRDSRTIFSGSAEGDAGVAARCSGVSSFRGCACGRVLAGTGWRVGGLAASWLFVLAACGAAAGVAGLADAAGAVEATDRAAAAGVAGFAGAGIATGLLATAGVALTPASLASWVWAAGASRVAAGLAAATGSCCTAGAGAATAAGGVASGTFDAACGAAAAASDGVGVCHSRWPATAATATSTTPPATAANLNFMTGAGLTGTARTCPWNGAAAVPSLRRASRSLNMLFIRLIANTSILRRTVRQK